MILRILGGTSHYRVLTILLYLALSISAGAAEPLVGLRLGASGLVPGMLSGWGMGVQGGVRWGPGLELSMTSERSNYSNDIKYLGLRAEALWNFSPRHRPWGLGLTGGFAQFSKGTANGKRFWNAGVISRLELQKTFSSESDSLRWGVQLLALLERPGAKALTALAPGFWIQKGF